MGFEGGGGFRARGGRQPWYEGVSLRKYVDQNCLLGALGAVWAYFFKTLE